MASTRAQQGALIKDPTFISQLTGALLAMAYAVVNEAVGVTNHANRLTYANAILVNPASQAAIMAPGVLPYAPILAAAGTPASILDSDVDARVIAVYNYYANQYAAQSIVGAPLNLGS